MSGSHDTTHARHRYGMLELMIFGVPLLMLIAWFVWLNLKLPLG